MQRGERLSLDQIRTFLEACNELRFEAVDRRELYEWVGRTLVEQEYARLRREGKRLVRSYIEKMTGLSRAQVNRLIRQYAETGQVAVKSYRRRRFPTRYSTNDIVLLPRSMKRTIPSAGRPRRRSCNWNITISRTAGLRIWRGFPWPICTGCGSGGRTGKSG